MGDGPGGEGETREGVREEEGIEKARRGVRKLGRGS